MKSMKRILAVLAAIVMALTACGIAAAEREARRMETAADADEWAAVFLGAHPEELEGAWQMTAQMEMAVRQLGGLQGLARQLAALGEVQAIGAAYEGEAPGFKVFHIPCVFSLLSADLILLTQDGVIAGLSTGAYTGVQEETAASGRFDSVDLSLPVPSLHGELPGVLTLPKGEGSFPAVVLVHGSGSSDRDESVGSLTPFRDLAEGLAEMGVAVYRFDKRTHVYGMEMAADQQITLEDESIEDAVNAVQLLARQEKIDPGRIWVLGHSLGGNAVPAIAGRLEQAPVKGCGYILMAASPRPLPTLIREQYDFLYSLLPEITPEQQAEKDAAFAELDKLNDPDAMADEDMVMGAYAAYWRWLAAYDALEQAKAIAEPCLLLQGEEDYQVTMEDFSLWQAALGEKDNWRMISYPGLTHCFTPGRKTEGAAAYARSEKVDAAVIRDIADFISQRAESF